MEPSHICFDVSTELEASGCLLTPARYSSFSEAVPRARVVTRRNPCAGHRGNVSKYKQKHEAQSHEGASARLGTSPKGKIGSECRRNSLQPRAGLEKGALPLLSCSAKHSGWAAGTYAGSHRMDLLDRERPGQRGGASQVLPRVPNSKPRVKITAQGLPVPLYTVIHPVHWPRGRGNTCPRGNTCREIAKAVWTRLSRFPAMTVWDSLKDPEDPDQNAT